MEIKVEVRRCRPSSACCFSIQCCAMEGKAITAIVVIMLLLQQCPRAHYLFQPTTTAPAQLTAALAGTSSSFTPDSACCRIPQRGSRCIRSQPRELPPLTLHSRAKVLLPDLKPLPSMISDISSMRASARVDAHGVTHVRTGGRAIKALAKVISDESFMEQFGSKKLPSWGHRDRLRALLVVVQHVAPTQAPTFLRAFSGSA